MQNELRESEIARRLSGRTDLAERVRQAEQERSQALASLGTADLARAETILAAETEHSAQIGSVRAEYRGLMGDDPTTEDVGVLRDEAAAEADECRHALAGMGDLGREPEKHLSAFQLAVQRMTPEREAALNAVAQAEAMVAANDIDAEKVAANAEALEDVEEQLAAAERRLRIYEDVLATLNDAESGTMNKAARFLEQRMARDIERITGGRYRRLRVDEATLTFSVFSPETNDWLDVRQTVSGHARPALPVRATGYRSPGDAAGQPTARVRRSVHHVRRRPGEARPLPAQGHLARSPGDLPDYVRSLRRHGRPCDHAPGANRG